jgi:hypothetical protein
VTRKADSGSMPVARRAGANPAANNTAASKMAAPALFDDGVGSGAPNAVR